MNKIKYFEKIRTVLLGEGNTRIFGLDLMRSVAILCVLFSHGRDFLKSIFQNDIKYLSIGGFIGVELFFVLSGFLIGGILIKIIDQSAGNFGLKEIKSFWIRRWYRTLPNYYLILLISCFIASYEAGHLIFDVKYIFFIQNFLKPISGQLNYSQSWSLTIEEWFYILTPIYFYLVVITSNKNIKRNLLLAIIFILLFYPAFKFLYSYLVSLFFNIGYNFNYAIFRSVTILRLDSLLYGVLFAYFNYYHKIKLDKLKDTLFFIGFVLFSISVFYSGYMLHSNIENPSLGVNIFFPSFTSISISLMIPFFNNIKQITEGFFSRFITYTSIISYSLYLIHWTIVLPFIIFIKVNDSLAYIFFWGLTYFLSTVNYFYFERKMTQLRDIRTNSNEINKKK